MKVALNNTVHALTGLTPFFVNSALHFRLTTLLAVRRSTASCGFTLGWDGVDKHRSSAAHGILSANLVTLSKAKSAVLTSRGVASPGPMECADTD